MHLTKNTWMHVLWWWWTRKTYQWIRTNQLLREPGVHSSKFMTLVVMPVCLYIRMSARPSVCRSVWYDLIMLKLVFLLGVLGVTNRRLKTLETHLSRRRMNSPFDGGALGKFRIRGFSRNPPSIHSSSSSTPASSFSSPAGGLDFLAGVASVGG